MINSGNKACLAQCFVLALSFGLPWTTRAEKVTITVEAGAVGKPISPDLTGIFFEDLNYAADGGLYAELIQNRSFEYQATEQPTWNSLTSWELTERGGGKGSIAVGAANPLHPNNPHHAVLQVTQVGEGVGLVNAGFDGIPVKAGENYEVSLFAKLLFSGNRWGNPSATDGPQPGEKSGKLVARLESKDGVVLGETLLDMPTKEWTRLTATLTAKVTNETARFVLLMKAKGGVAVDVVSLFPKKTFRDRPNGLRADLAQVIADLKPKFVRFPGGCLVHGDGLDNMYRWKDTVGPIEQRKEQSNLWNYHQSVGLGYFEFFQFCEDIGAKPLPVVAAGVCCQNSGYVAEGTGQKGLPLEMMPSYIQEVLDLIEYANGAVTTPWGAKRAAAGHPEPFRLQYLGVGNEDRITSVFKERFQAIYEAIKLKHPEITVVGTVGPFPDGEDYENGWKIADELQVPVVDEHYYKPPQWFWDNLKRYDAYDRRHSKVYVGEYAAHDDKRRSTLRSALAEAAHLTSLERNGDVVHLASYAPLLAKRGHTNWNPDLIYFTNTEVFPTINYYVQQLFSVNSGDRYLTTTVKDSSKVSDLASSCVSESMSGDLILKIVNASGAVRALHIELAGVNNVNSEAIQTVLAGSDPMMVNDATAGQTVLPRASTITVGRDFGYEAPANSLTVFRIKSGPVK